MTETRFARIGVSIGFVLVGVVFLLQVFAGSGTGAGNLAAGDTPNALPRMLVSIWVALAGLDLVRQFVARPPKATPAERAEEAGGEGASVLVVMGLTMLIAIAVVFLGFLVPIVVGLPILLYVSGTRRPLALGLAFLVLGPGLWALFHHVLAIRLPILVPGGLF